MDRKGGNMFKQIIAATDRVSLPDAPVLAAVQLMKAYDAKLDIIHVLESVSMADQLEKDIPSAPEYARKAESGIRQTYEPYLAGASRVGFTVCTGYPWVEILRQSKRLQADLVVLGPHSNRVLEKGVVSGPHRIGSTVQDVVARENCPVMVVNDSVTGFHVDFKKIVVGIDFSIASECALCFSARLSRRMGSVIYPLFMIPAMPYPKFTRQQYELNHKVQERKLVDFCDVYLDGVAHEYVVKSGMLPHLEIVKWARNAGADLILLGSHTKIKAGKWYAGSVVEQAGSTAGCPVVVVNDPEALHPWEDIQPPALNIMPAAGRDLHMFDTVSGPLTSA